jgi:hypothetical protein
MAAATAAESKQPQTKTIYFASHDVYEAGIAQAWAKQHGRRITTGLPLDRLTADMVIVPIVRGTDRTPLRYEQYDKELGRSVQRQRKAEELTAEVRECTPIPVAKYWTTDRQTVQLDDFAELLAGMLDTTSFIDAVNRSTAVHEVYARTHHGDNDSILRLSWGS